MSQRKRTAKSTSQSVEEDREEEEEEEEDYEAESASSSKKKSKQTAAAKKRAAAHDDGDDDDDDAEAEKPKKGKRASKKAAQDDDDDDEAAAGASGGKGALSPEEMNQKVKDLVRLALFCERKTQTIKRDEISKQVLKEAPKAFPVVFARANEELRDVFGFEMVPIDARERAPAALSGAVSTKKAKPATARQYILKNLLLPPEDNFINWQGQLQEIGLLQTILALVLMSERRTLSGERLWQLLELVNVNRTSNHTAFGDVEKLVAKFVKDGYLNRIRTDQQQAEEAYEFRWGPRATVLCPVEDILSFIATMNGKANDEKFLANLQDILKANSPADDDEEGAEGADAGATQATQA